MPLLSPGSRSLRPPAAGATRFAAAAAGRSSSSTRSGSAAAEEVVENSDAESEPPKSQQPSQEGKASEGLGRLSEERENIPQNQSMDVDESPAEGGVPNSKSLAGRADPGPGLVPDFSAFNPQNCNTFDEYGQMN